MLVLNGENRLLYANRADLRKNEGRSTLPVILFADYQIAVTAIQEAHEQEVARLQKEIDDLKERYEPTIKCYGCEGLGKFLFCGHYTVCTTCHGCGTLTEYAR